MNVAVFGAGYVGSVTAGCLAHLGHRVWLVEISPEKLRMLERGVSPVVEPGLDHLLGEGLRCGRVVPVKATNEAVRETELALICVGTPSRPDGAPETRQVTRVVHEIAQALEIHPRRYVVGLRSTLPFPQVEAEVLPVLASGRLAHRWGRDVFFAVNPEFLREGKGIEDFMHPPYVLVGTDYPEAVRVFRELYDKIECPFYAVSPGTASLLKYASNAFHALKVAFANEVAALEQTFRADAEVVMELFCEDRALNISRAYLRPGYAFGGSCLPKDLRALTQMASLGGIPTPLLSAVLPSNELVVARAMDLLRRMGHGTIGFLGLSFKPGTDDLRESPLVDLAERLVGEGFNLRIYDPDIRVEVLQGLNLRYLQNHLPHLASLMVKRVEDLPDHGAAAQIVVIGKPLVTKDRLIDLYPPGTRVLDLMRCLPANARPLKVIRL